MANLCFQPTRLLPYWAAEDPEMGLAPRRGSGAQPAVRVIITAFTSSGVNVDRAWHAKGNEVPRTAVILLAPPVLGLVAFTLAC
jgi:hypothetical protein